MKILITALPESDIDIDIDVSAIIFLSNKELAKTEYLEMSQCLTHSPLILYNH